MSKKYSNIIFHLDLKGSPPKPDYLKTLWPILKKWGITGVLLEWEDAFPYSEDLSALWNQVYSIEDSLNIIQSLRDVGLEIIPLVQSFGHLEFVLKHPAFIGLREVPLYPSSICPSHPKSLELVLAVVNQVIAFHGPDVKHFHIGADEVWHMGLCERCRVRISCGETKQDLFLRFVGTVLDGLKRKWPNVSFIMWDDMLRSMDEPLIRDSGLNEMVEPMVWHYHPAETFFIHPNVWKNYTGFSGVWVAGAFKGASGGSQIVTPIAHHTSNASRWLQCLEKVVLPIRGFVFTGWSRYDHFASLCELLPCGLPALATCVNVIKGNSSKKEVLDNMLKDLEIGEPTDMTNKNSVGPQETMLSASRQIFYLTQKLKGLRMSAINLVNSELIETWMNEWQVRNNRVNPMQIVPLISSLKELSDEFIFLEGSLRSQLTLIFYPSTVEEFIATYTTIIHNRLKSILNVAENIVAASAGKISTVEMDSD